MKKQKKIDLIASGIGNEQLVRMYFKYDENYWYFYPNAVSERLMLGQEENDFQLNGYQIRRISDLVKAEITDPDGKIAFRNDGIGGAVQFTADQAAAKPGVWKVRFDKPQVGGPHTYLGYYNLRFMGVSPYIGLREDRTPVLGKKISKLPSAKTGKFDAAYF